MDDGTEEDIKTRMNQTKKKPGTALEILNKILKSQIFGLRSNSKFHLQC